MKNTISFFSQRNVLLSFLLTGLFFLLGMTNTSAQDSYKGTDNPHTAIAQYFTVTAYPLGHFQPNEVIQKLTGIITPLKQVIGQGNATQAQKLKYTYVTQVLSDVQYHIAVEISLLKRLDELKKGKTIDKPADTAQTVLSQISTSDLHNLYNEIVNQLQ